MSQLELFFSSFRQHTIGQGVKPQSASHDHPILYADWTASGRLYRPIEDYVTGILGPYVANTHTETTLTGVTMTQAYEEAKQVIREHVNANQDDILIFAGYGMTSVVNKFQRILGLRGGAKPRQSKPLVLVSHMEHYSNQISWLECEVDLEVVPPCPTSRLPDLERLEAILKRNSHRSLIIGAFTACSNATGVITPYHKMAELVHAHGGICVIDFAASAPYVDIDMHPENAQQALDAIFFSPHKFLGGPGASGVMLFNKNLYDSATPDQPGGGTIASIDYHGRHHYVEDISKREDGGTPGFLQAIRAALAIRLKDTMGVDNILARERELIQLLVAELELIPDLVILEKASEARIGVISFYVEQLHHDDIVRALNDGYGIQTRGGVSCAGYYGHILLNQYQRKKLGCDQDDDPQSPSGWVRVSLHPIMSNAEVRFIANAVTQVVTQLRHSVRQPGDTKPATGVLRSFAPSLREFEACPQ